MTTQQLPKIGLILAILLGLTASVSAAQIKIATDGVGELPVFYVYAFDEGTAPEDLGSAQDGWKYEKSLDKNGNRVAVDVLLPNEQLVKVETPAIAASLVGS